MRISTVLFALVLAPLMAACTEAADPGAEMAAVSLDEVVVWSDTVPLEEDDRTIIVAPVASVDPRGGLLIGDARENQVRRYDAEGRLLTRFGSKGSGPAEFNHIMGVLRDRSGGILVGDFSGKLAMFDSAGQVLTWTARAPIGPMMDLHPLDDSLLVLVGRLEGVPFGEPMIHLWDLGGDSIQHSFFRPPAPAPGLEGAHAFTGNIAVAARGDTLAAFYVLDDTLRFFSRAGAETGKVKIPFRHFRPLREPMPVQFAPNSPEAKQWIESFSTGSGVYWLSDGTFLVQYFDVVGDETRFNLLRMTRDGELRFDLVGTPRLLAVSEGPDPTLYFVDPAAETPNRLLVGRLRFP